MRKFLQIGFIIVLWLGFLANVFLIQETHPDGAGDYVAYYNASNRILDGEPLYTGLSGSKPYLYPPFLAQMMLPIVQNQSFKGSARIWFAINIFVLIGTLWTISHTLPSKRSKTLLWVGAPFFTPFFVTFLHGQVAIILFALITGAWYANNHEKHGVAGGLIAIAAWIKVFPVLLVAYFLWKRDWKFLSGLIITSIVVVAFQIIGVGLDTFLSYFTRVLGELSASGQIGISHSNYSVYGFSARLFADPPFVQNILVSDVLLSLTRWGLLSILAIGTFITLNRRTGASSKEHRFNLEFGMVLLFTLLATTSLTPSGASLVYLVYILLAISTPLTLRRKLSRIYVISFLLITLHFLIILGQLDHDNKIPALLLSGPFFGMLILWEVIIYILNYPLSQNQPIDNQQLGIITSDY